MDLRIGLGRCRRGERALPYLISLMIFALSLLSQGIAAAQESNELSVEQFCFDLDDSKGMLRKLKEHAILEQENGLLRQEIVNLKDQLKLKDALLEIGEERRKILLERADFYQKMTDAEAKLADRYAEQSEKLQKQLDRKVFWEKIGLLAGVVAGIFVGLHF